MPYDPEKQHKVRPTPSSTARLTRRAMPAVAPHIVRAEAENKKLRAELAAQLLERMRTQGWSQAEAARHFGVTQPRVSDLARGKTDLFRLDALVKMLVASGLSVNILVCDA